MRTTTVIVIVLATIAFPLPSAEAEEEDVTGEAVALLGNEPGDCIVLDAERFPPVYMAPC